MRDKGRHTMCCSTVKHGGGLVMLWGCFGEGDSVQMTGIMKKVEYHSVLRHHTIPSVLCVVGQNFIVQVDNDPRHSTKLCQNYIQSKEKEEVLSRHGTSRSHKLEMNVQ